MQVDRKSGVVRETTVVDLFGNRTTIAFDQMRENTRPAADLFLFTPPWGARDQPAGIALIGGFSWLFGRPLSTDGNSRRPAQLAAQFVARPRADRRWTDGRVRIAAGRRLPRIRGGRLDASCAGLAPIRKGAWRTTAPSRAGWPWDIAEVLMNRSGLE